MAKEMANTQISTAPSPFKVMWGEIKSDWLAMISFTLIIAIMLTAFILGGILDNAEIAHVDLMVRNLPPSRQFPLGTDPGGRNMIDQLAVGMRNSFVIALTVAFASAVIGLVIGLISGFYGGTIDNIVMRIIDFFSMLPTLLILIVILVLVPNVTPVKFALILVIFNWVGFARQIRMKTLQQGVMEYVQASKTLGTLNIVIMFREVLPNIISFVVVNLTILVAGSMGIETGLTFLGFGLPPQTPSLGTLIAHASNPETLRSRPWQWLIAALLVLLMMLCINYVGQALNRAADAKRRRV